MSDTRLDVIRESVLEWLDADVADEYARELEAALVAYEESDEVIDACAAAARGVWIDPAAPAFADFALAVLRAARGVKPLGLPPDGVPTEGA